MKYDVFISYSTHDKNIVEEIRVFLEKNNLKCYVGYRDCISNYAREIPTAIKNSNVFLAVCSENYNNSEETSRELDLATKYKIRIIPFLIKDIKFKNGKEYYLSNISWINAYPFPKNSFDKLLHWIKLKSPIVPPRVLKIRAIPIILIIFIVLLAIFYYSKPSTPTFTTCILHQFEETYPLCDGLYAVLEKDCWGFCSNDSIYIHPKYEQVFSFSEHVAAVYEERLWHYIDINDSTIIKGPFNMAYSFMESVAAVKDTNNNWGFINHKGDYIISPSSQYVEVYSFSRGLAAVKDRNNLWGFIDKNGTNVIECQYEAVTSFDEDNMAMIKKNDLWGVIDNKGQRITDNIYTDIKPFHEGRAAIKRNKLWGYIDRRGNEVIAPQFADAFTHASNGLAVVKKNKNSSCYVDKNNLYIDFEFDKAYDFYNGLAKVIVDGKSGFIDENNTFVIECIYEKALSFLVPDYTAVCINGKWGIINRKNEFLCQPHFDRIVIHNDGCIHALKERRWINIDKYGKEFY